MSHVLALLRDSDKPLTHAQLAHMTTGVPPKACADPIEERERQAAIRAVQEEIESLRRAQHPIIPTGRGMKYARSPQEAREGAERIERTIATMHESARALRRWAEAMELAVQPTLWEAA